MGPLTQRLQALLEPTVESLGCELVGVEFTGQGAHSRLRLFIDKPAGITLQDCEQVSRQASALLDVEDPIQGHYALEVSSPGLDRPLFKLADYNRFVGQQVKLRLHQAHAGQRNFKGRIAAVLATNIELTTEEGVAIVLAYSNIEKANLIPDF
ncbi:MAG: ribosome maturation factor RimP [Gammaproteobacteria bacterium]|nr:ribosome maturation factor RimP [Gammaproteobacteria bacterium]